MQMKKILKRVLIVFLILIAIIIAIPFLFKGKIISMVKAELNKNVNAKIEFDDIDISLIRHFPRLAVAIEDLSVVNLAPFEGDTLVSVRKIDMAMNLMSAIKGDHIEIYKVNIEQPRVHAIINKEGLANWDISKPSEDSSATEAADTTSSNLQLDLQKYSIEDGYVVYNDQEGDMILIVNDLDHEGSGDFTLDNFVLNTHTTIGGINFSMGIVPYLVNTKASLDADINIDNKTSTYSFKTDQLKLNNLQLATEGFVKMVDPAINMDIKFNAPSTKFKDLLSLVPAVFLQDFNDIKTDGKASFEGYVKGDYTDNSLPAFGIQMQVKDGFFQYPDLPKPVKNIQLALNVANPGGDADQTVINLSQAHLEFDQSPIDLRMLIKTPVSDMYLDAAAKTNLDLSKINQFVKLDQGTALQGLLDADIQAKGHMSSIEQEKYDQFYAAGAIKLQQMLYKSKDYPGGVKINTFSMLFNPKNVKVSELSGNYLGTNFKANGELDNLLAYVFKNKALEGKLSVSADQLDLDKFMATGSESTPQKTTETAPSPDGPFVVPNNLDFTLNANVDKVHYDKLDLTNLSGALKLKDETVYMQDIKANGLEGNIKINGTYSTKESKTTPDINLSYDVQNLDIQKTFLAFNTVQKLMPIAQFLSGKISSSLKMEGKLGEDMSPILNTLSGDGTLFLIQGVLKKFEPVDQLASQLNISQLKDISVRDIKNYFAFENGRVTVNPFRIKTNGLDILVGGSHGFDQSLDYTLQLNVPRSVIGSQGNAFINNLASQAKSKGVPVNISDSVHLQVAMGGNILKPSIKTDLRETTNALADNLKNQATAMVQEKVEESKKALQDSLNQVKKEVGNAVKDQIKDQLLGKKDTDSTKTTENSKDKVEKTLNNTLKGLLNKKKNTADTSKSK